jgi:beta-hydroxylase
MFYDPNIFHWTKQLADNWTHIRSEYDLISKKAVRWPEKDIHNGKWGVIGFLFQERKMLVSEHAPITCQICDNIPGIHTYGFSIMKPGCEIHPHVGYTGKVLRCHLGLHTNSKSAIMVDDEVRSWSDGEVLVFDDTKMHSAWNRGSTDRVILLLDFAIAKSSI